MKERPILFSGPMVRAILEGQKTVTRRAVKPQFMSAPVDVVDGVPSWDRPANYAGEVTMNTQRGKPCPYGKPGDRLWVRETWLEDPEDDGTWAYTQYMGCKGSPLSDIPKRFQKPDHCIFRASWKGPDMLWRPSIHMPRWASRILLEISDVRVERLQDINEDQVLDEGIGDHRFDCDRPVEPDGYPACSCGSIGYIDAFADLWNTINGRGAWDANPWVWVVEFKRIQA